MIHKMKLVDFTFNAMKNKSKDIEIRLYDEKRQLIKEKDIIEFKNLDTGEIIKTQVIKLHIFDTFYDLFKNFEHKRLGLNDSDNASLMNKFYSDEEQKKYKALGIEIKIIEK